MHKWGTEEKVKYSSFHVIVTISAGIWNETDRADSETISAYVKAIKEL